MRALAFLGAMIFAAPAFAQLAGSPLQNPPVSIAGPFSVSGTTSLKADAQLGGASMTTATGELGLTKIAASGSAPGAGAMKFDVVAGTNGGTCKLIAYAGTSATPVTVVDNVGSGC